MAQVKNIQHGTTFSRQTGTPTTIGQIRSITMPVKSREEIEGTDLDDTVRIFIPADPEDPGELTIEYFWTPEDTVDVLFDDDFDARTVASWRVTFASPAKTATFDAWVKSMGGAVIEAGGGLLSRTIVLRLQSRITWA